MRVLLTGATGLIGTATASRLVKDGHEVIGVARRTQPERHGVTWLTLDMRDADRPEHWLPHLAGIDAVVNCAGVLQDGAEDSARAAHVTGPIALFAACASAGVKRVIQISAIGIDRETPTEFSLTKREGDGALMATELEWIILRPSVVVGRAAYGGSALFRGLATLPVIPRAAGTGPLQVVQIDDLVETIVHYLRPGAPCHVELEIVGPDRLSFDDTVATYRAWLGWQPARHIATPQWLLRALARLGDIAGWFGWRPPIRTTALREIARGAVGDPAPWIAATGIHPRSLAAALAAEPATVQERWFACLYLLKPLVFCVLVLFWIATGVVSLASGWQTGMELMHQAGLTGFLAPLTIVAGALADLCIGVGIAFRRTARPALWAAFALSVAYMVIGTILVPQLWSDPLGPLLKIWPILALNLVAIAILEDR